MACKSLSKVSRKNNDNKMTKVKKGQGRRWPAEEMEDGKEICCGWTSASQNSEAQDENDEMRSVRQANGEGVRDDKNLYGKAQQEKSGVRVRATRNKFKTYTGAKRCQSSINIIPIGVPLFIFLHPNNSLP